MLEENMGKGMYRFVINRTHVELLIALSQGEKSLEECSKRTGTTYTHLSNVVNELKKEEIIDRDKSKMPYDLKLTPKGMALVKKLKEVKEIIERWDELPSKQSKEEESE